MTGEKWNYRVLYCEETQLLGIYKVLYDESGNYKSHSEQPAHVSTDKRGQRNLLDCLAQMAIAVEKPWHNINNVSVATSMT